MPVNRKHPEKTKTRRKAIIHNRQVPNRVKQPISVQEHRDLPRDWIHPPRSHFHNNIGLKTVTSDYTALKTDHYIECNGTLTVTLYKSVYKSNLVVVNIGTGEVTLGSETVNGYTDMILDCNSAIDIYGNATEWRIG